MTECKLCRRFVSSLPLTDFQFTVSLSHDVPLATSLGHCLYVLGSIQRTGEKLLLQYNTQQGTVRQSSTALFDQKNIVLFPVQKAQSCVCCCLLIVFSIAFSSVHSLYICSLDCFHTYSSGRMKNSASAFSLCFRLLVWTASHPHQSRCRPPYSLLPGCHWQAACDWWKQLRERRDIVLCAVTEMGRSKNLTKEWGCVD